MFIVLKISGSVTNYLVLNQSHHIEWFLKVVFWLTTTGACASSSYCVVDLLIYLFIYVFTALGYWSRSDTRSIPGCLRETKVPIPLNHECFGRCLASLISTIEMYFMPWILRSTSVWNEHTTGTCSCISCFWLTWLYFVSAGCLVLLRWQQAQYGFK